jgi:hypothetical protein
VKRLTAGLTFGTRLLVVAVVAVAFAMGGCGRGRETHVRAVDDLCPLLAERMDARLRAHRVAVASRPPSFAVDIEPDDKNYAWRTVDAVRSTYRAAIDFGPGCASDERAECSLRSIDSAAGLEDALRRIALVADGMRGRGPCAPTPPPGRQVASCSEARRQLYIAPQDAQRVRDDWAKAPGTGSAMTPALESQARTSRSAAESDLVRWRALVDYGIAVAPVCAKGLPSCARPSEGLGEAQPEELLSRIDALRTAFVDGTPCPTVGSFIAPAPSATGDADGSEGAVMAHPSTTAR